MNWIVCPTHNLLPYLKSAVSSFQAQDIETNIMVFDNCSTDGTREWLRTVPTITSCFFDYPLPSVAKAWNYALSYLFNTQWNYTLSYLFKVQQQEHVLVVNNDVELRPDAYRKLLADPAGFVTCVGVGADQWVKNSTENPSPNRRPHPDFSCFLIRKYVWDKVGPFDENYKVAFCEDCDYHCRMHQAGIEAVSIDVPFLHHASMTIKTAPRWRQDEISRQAEANRKYFYKKWGFRISSPEYEQFFQDVAYSQPQG